MQKAKVGTIHHTGATSSKFSRRRVPYAEGGAFDYVVNGRMILGFALVAYPVEYGNSGIMTFVVNQNGVVYQKDLGKNTGKIAAAMKSLQSG